MNLARLPRAQRSVMRSARGDVQDGVENACQIGVRRELREGIQLACVEILEGLVIFPAYF